MSYIVNDVDKAVKVIKDLSKAFYFNDVQIRLRPSPFRLTMEFFDPNGRSVSGFTLMEQPNCCGALISTKTFVSPDFQKRGIAQEMMPLKEAIAREFGYSCLTATVNVTGNPAESHILQKHGWKYVSQFVNSRTKNTVAFFIKNL